MNELQKNLIENLAGRAMTAEEIAMANVRNDFELAKSLSVGRTKLVECYHTKLKILDVLGPVPGGAFIDALDAIVAGGKEGLPESLKPYFTAISESVSAMAVNAPGLNMGSPNTQAVIDLLASLGLVDSGSANILKTIAVHPDLISVDTISNILNEVN